MGGSPEQHSVISADPAPQFAQPATQFEHRVGRRVVKDYPVSQGELWGLGGLGFGATLAFSTASGFLGFFIDTKKDLELAGTISGGAVAYWEAMRDMALYGAIFATLVGFLFIGFGAFKIWSIIKTTRFDG